MTSLFCKPCNKTLSGPAPYLDHIKSAKHQKRVASLEKLESFLDDKGEPAGAATSVPVPENNPFECKVCRVSTNSLGSLEAHNRGKKHLKALKVQEDLQKLNATILRGAPVVPQEHATSSVPSPQQRKVAPSASATALQTETPQEASPLATGQPEREQSTGQPGKELSTGQPEKEQSSTRGVDLSCDCCGIVLFKNIEYKLEHLETDAHNQKRLSQSIEDQEPAPKKPRLEAVVETSRVAKITPVVAAERDGSSDNDSYDENTYDWTEEHEEEEAPDIVDIDEDLYSPGSVTSD
ncbi:zinc finger protein 346 [Ixodes scapularis]|uniref:zinc finger protein 346 n=1 Tax=Ixodes scapularis TaxID=6945 RepID=UPI001A9DA4D5|nr:zinc finger protein 346 [Ixodes scapularis]